ncbi:MAG: rod shape-determining protein MreC [Solirubrobacteraceae bacterium]|jgi:rod shape-determining protein MreC|nr:rod shape-determining protein MreC [Solirubrobacteraceae bacterium]
MYDKQVRRRRLVLAAFVALSIGLLTVYFGESSGGSLHAVQRGALSVLGPIQEGASRALKPFRDLFGWVGDTLDAKKQRDGLLKKNVALERQVTDLQAQADENKSLKSLLQINEQGGLNQYDPVKARVTARSATLFYSRMTIDKGSSAGVAAGQPVVNGAGLVGRVTEVTTGYSIVTLLTDETFAAGARVLTSGQQTTVQASLSKPGDLELELVQNPDKVHRGDRVITAGSTSVRLTSYFPPGIPIGRVSRIEVGDGALDRRIHVRPAVDLGTLQFVEVLTKQAPVQTVASATGTPGP